MRSVWIISNLDGHERIAAAETFASVSKWLPRAKHLQVTRHDLSRKIGSLPNDALCFLATHGGYAEDGTLQSLLEKRRILHTHSSAAVARTLINKHRTKLHYLETGIPTPGWKFGGNEFGREFRSCCVKKPLNGGSKRGLRIMMQQAKTSTSSIYEELIPGNKEVSVCILGSERTTALPPVLRLRSTKSIGKLEPAHEPLDLPTAVACSQMAEGIHRSLRAAGITKTDFLLAENGEIFAIETDCHPGLGEGQATLTAARLQGLGAQTVFEGLLSDAIK